MARCVGSMIRTNSILFRATGSLKMVHGITKVSSLVSRILAEACENSSKY